MSSVALDLIGEARRLITEPGVLPPDVVTRTAGVLGRQAIEDGLARWWDATGLAQAGGVGPRARFLTLVWMVPRCSVAGCPGVDCSAEICVNGVRTRMDTHRVWTGKGYTAWTLLCLTCHHHAYQLPPNVAEVAAWLADAELFLAELDAYRPT